MSQFLALGAIGLLTKTQDHRNPLSLRVLGDPILKTPSNDVEKLAELPWWLVDDMRSILQRERGLGLAAQQVGVLWRIALLRLTDGSFAPKATVVAINLRIVARSKETFVHPGEGCLSIQGQGRYFRTSVRRHRWVRVTYRDEHWVEQARRLEGDDAIVAQHECDHLDGRCIIDGVSRQQRRAAERLSAKGAR